MNQILGVTYKNNPNTVEHQWFPVEYFSGSDITIYIGDIFVSEISAISFTLTEKVLPIFGYASRTFDHASRGSRLVEGVIQIPFVEAGYLEAILSRVGSSTTETSNAKPKLAYVKGNKAVPSWCADFKMDIEGALVSDARAKGIKGITVIETIEGIVMETPNKTLTTGNTQNGLSFVGGAGVGGLDYTKKTAFNDRVENYEAEIWGRDFSQDRDRKYQSFFYEDRKRTDGTNTQEILKQTGFDIYITYGPQAEAEKYNTLENPKAQALRTYSFNTTVKAIRGIQLTSTGQTISANGNPLYEEYSFIAKDLD